MKLDLNSTFDSRQGVSQTSFATVQGDQRG